MHNSECHVKFISHLYQRNVIFWVWHQMISHRAARLTQSHSTLLVLNIFSAVCWAKVPVSVRPFLA